MLPLDLNVGESSCMRAELMSVTRADVMRTLGLVSYMFAIRIPKSFCFKQTTSAATSADDIRSFTIVEADERPNHKSSQADGDNNKAAAVALNVPSTVRSGAVRDVIRSYTRRFQ